MPHIQFTINGQFENVALVGRAINTICTSVCSSATAYQIELATVEVCNNIVEHAYRSHEGLIEIDLTLQETLLELKFSDAGLAMERDLLTKPALEFNPDDLENVPEGGMGLYLIDTIMDSSSYSRIENTNVLVLTKQLNVRQEA